MAQAYLTHTKVLTAKYFMLTLIGKSWKTHPEFFLPTVIFSFPGYESDSFTGKLIQFFSKLQFWCHELDRMYWKTHQSK